jgi:hypothetical protein
MRLARPVGIVALLCASCAAKPTRYPAPQSAWQAPNAAPSPSAPSAPAPTTPPVFTPPPPPPDVTFTELPELRFRAGPPLKLVPIATNVYDFAALSPDATSWLASLSRTPNGKAPLKEGLRLVTPALPDGQPVDSWVPFARFSPDGRRALVWSFGGFAVIEIPSGRRLFEGQIAACAARFSGPDEIVLHQYSKEPDARLLRLRLSTGQLTPLGAPRQAETCEASPDGSRWLVSGYDTKTYVDGATGAAIPITAPAGTEIALSPGANRHCFGSERGLSCVRWPDGGVEHVWARPTGDSPTFDLDGRFALVTYVDNPEGVYRGFAFVDFDARTVRILKGFRGYSGSLFIVHPGGKLISIGSGSGLHVFDVERGQSRFAAHRPLYDNHADPNLPRRVIVGTDNVEDVFYVDVK